MLFFNKLKHFGQDQGQKEKIKKEKRKEKGKRNREDTLNANGKTLGRLLD